MKSFCPTLSALLVFAAAAAFPETAPAQEWKPAKPIRFIVGFAPGGSADILARLLRHSPAPALPRGAALALPWSRKVRAVLSGALLYLRQRSAPSHRPCQAVL